MIELENRMVIKTKDGKLFLIIDGRGVRCSKEVQFCDTWGSTLVDYVAMVFEKVPFDAIHEQMHLDIPITECIWGGSKEMTIAEIEKELGYKVKVVR
jgi:hypothetical protein